MIKFLIILFMSPDSGFGHYRYYQDPEKIMDILTEPNNTWLIIAENYPGVPRRRAAGEEWDRCVHFTIKKINGGESWDGFCYYMPSGTEYSYVQFIGHSGIAKDVTMFQGVASTVKESEFKNAILRGLCTEKSPFFVIVNPVIKNIYEKDKHLQLLLVVAVTDTPKENDEDESDRTYKTALFSTNKLNESSLEDVLRQLKVSYFDIISGEHYVKSPKAISDCTLPKNVTDHKVSDDFDQTNIL